MDLHKWNLILLEVSKQIPSTYYDPFISPLSLKETRGETLIIKAPSDMIKNHVETKYQHYLEDAIEKVSGNKLKIEINVDDNVQPISNFVNEKFRDESFQFNSEFAFENFILGESNRMVHSACREVIDKPGQSFNPLFIYGKIGVGKTHILHAIGMGIKELHQLQSVKYISITTFLSEFVFNVQNRQNLEEFRSKYQSYTTLIIDDMQYLNSSAEKTQDEFYSLFNFLYERRKQIIISSDRAVSELPLQDRLKSRFATGLQIELHSPDNSVRESIIKRKSIQLGLNLSEESIRFISENFKYDTRSMIGSLNELALYKKTYNLLILSEEKIIEILQSRITKIDRADLTADKILSCVSEFYAQEKSDILSKSRRSEFILPRHISMYLLHEVCKMNKSVIGKMFQTSHPTIISALNKIRKRMNEDASLKRTIESFRKKFELQ